MKILLLAGYRTPVGKEIPVGLHVDGNGQSILSSQIIQWSNIGFEVVTILAGPQAEEQIRKCRELDNIEIAFDTTANPTLISNLSAGLYTTEESALVQPVELPFPGRAVCSFLKNESGKIIARSPHTFLQAVDDKGAPCHMGFPLLVTRSGNQLIRSLDDLSGLNDPRLNYLKIPFFEAPTLASPGQSL
jgi:hypothetical protein